MKIKFDKNLPTKVVAKATELLARVESGELHTNKIKANKARSIEVGRSHRAIMFDGEDTWFVCSHERYNRFITKGRKSQANRHA
ncbi:MAG: hypothetical protein ACRC9I_04440 [Acinetobacter sp.]